MTLVSASLMACDFMNLRHEIESISNAGADMLHLDVMDGHFVPNLTFGADLIKSIRKHSKLPLDVHLMIDKPEQWINVYHDAGADILTIHPESTLHLDRTITMIKTLGVKSGVALLPTTPISVLDYILDKIDLILVMTVNPGFGGQQFLSSQVDKISSLCHKIKGRQIVLAVDGGINNHTANVCTQAGATLLVSGSYIFTGDYSKRITQLKLQ